MRLFLGGSKGLVLYEDGDLTELAADPVLCLVRPSAGRVFAGTEAGAVLRWESGTGTQVVTKDIGDAVTALAAVAGGGLLAGTSPAGIWTSKDGELWKEVASVRSAPDSDGWAGASGPALVSAIAVHPKNPRTIYLGVEVGGVYRSRDGGKRWFNMGVPCPDVHSIQISPGRHERVFVTTGMAGDGRGGFCSDDEGFNWRPMGTANQRQYALGLTAHPTEADRVILSASEGPPSSWRGRPGARCDVYLSTDAGKRFRTVVRGLRGGVRPNALVLNQKVPSEVVFATSTGELWYSSDGGESFDQVGDSLGDVFSLAFA